MAGRPRHHDKSPRVYLRSGRTIGCSGRVTGLEIWPLAVKPEYWKLPRHLFTTHCRLRLWGPHVARVNARLGFVDRYRDIAVRHFSTPQYGKPGRVNGAGDDRCQLPQEYRSHALCYDKWRPTLNQELGFPAARLNGRSRVITDGKQECGIAIDDAQQTRSSPCPPEKRPAIKQAFRHFGMLPPDQE